MDGQTLGILGSSKVNFKSEIGRFGLFVRVGGRGDFFGRALVQIYIGGIDSSFNVKIVNF